MLTSIYEALGGFFSHPAVANYVFPIMSAVYITFLTARIIKFQDAKRAAIKELDTIEIYVRSAPVDLPIGKWQDIIFSIRGQFVSSPHELMALGHLEAAMEVERISADLTSRIFEAVYTAEIPPMWPSIERSAKERDQIEQVNYGLSYRMAAATAVRNSLDEFKRDIDNVHISWIAILGLRSSTSLIKQLVDRVDHLLAKETCRSITPCSKCRQNPTDAV